METSMKQITVAGLEKQKVAYIEIQKQEKS
jgi:hypothetical protein